MGERPSLLERSIMAKHDYSKPVPKSELKGWHVLLAWIVFFGLSTLAVQNLSTFLSAPVVAFLFSIVWIISEAYGQGEEE